MVLARKWLIAPVLYCYDFDRPYMQLWKLKAQCYLDIHVPFFLKSSNVLSRPIVSATIISDIWVTSFLLFSFNIGGGSRSSQCEWIPCNCSIWFQAVLWCQVEALVCIFSLQSILVLSLFFPKIVLLLLYHTQYPHLGESLYGNYPEPSNLSRHRLNIWYYLYPFPKLSNLRINTCKIKRLSS